MRITILIVKFIAWAIGLIFAYLTFEDIIWSFDETKIKIIFVIVILFIIVSMFLFVVEIYQLRKERVNPKTPAHQQLPDPPNYRRFDIKRKQRNWAEQYYSEINELQQRFNWFLVLSSFLLIAFITTITVSDNKLIPINIHKIITGLIIVAAFILSVYFWIINFYQADMARVIRNNQLNRPVISRIDGNIYRPRHYEFVYALLSWLRDHRGYSEENVAVHTWLVPFGFTLLWIAILGCWLYVIWT